MQSSGIDFDYISMAMKHRQEKQELYVSLVAHVLRQSRKQKVIQLYNSKASSLASLMITTLTFWKIHGRDKGNNLNHVGSVVHLLAMMFLGQQLDDGFG